LVKQRKVTKYKMVVNNIKMDSKMVITVAILIKIKVKEWMMMDL
jgi:hypothetical protein